MELTQPLDCPCCFARLLLGTSAPPEVSCPQSPPQTTAKRGVVPGFTGETPDAKRTAAGWSVADVASDIESLSLGCVKDKFAASGVDGRFLIELSEDDLMSELACRSVRLG